MGYRGVLFAVDAIEGKVLPKYVDTGVVAVTRDNFEDDEVFNLLNPDKRAEAVLTE